MSNLALRCAAHNALAAEEDFGREFMQQRKDALEHDSEHTNAAVEHDSPFAAMRR